MADNTKATCRPSRDRCCKVRQARKVALLTLVALVGVVSLAFRLYVTFYLRVYYHGAHVAGMTSLAAIFVLVRDVCSRKRPLCCCRRWLRLFVGLCMVVVGVADVCIAAAYTALATISLHTNFDFVWALVFGWAGVVLMLYLISAMATDCRKSPTGRRRPTANSEQPMELEKLSGDCREDGDQQQRHPPSCCFRCCKCMLGTLLCVFLLTFLSLTVFVFLTTAYNSVATYQDQRHVRTTQHLYTVRVPGHKPLDLFLRCTGNGSETLVLENGLGGMAYIAWEFLPHLLRHQYTVCVHDRRGYGWSETFESDYASILNSQPQISFTNGEFFAALVEQAGIRKPFFYAGHSYGGHHILNIALRYPHMVKGLVFLDSAFFSALDIFMDLVEVLANLLPTGLLRFCLAAGVVDLEAAFEPFVSFSEISPHVMDVILAQMFSGYYFTAMAREAQLVYGIGGSQFLLRKALKLNNTIIPIPTLVVDAAWSSGDASWVFDWFPGEHFSSYHSQRDYILVPEATHAQLVYRRLFANQTAHHIDRFIQRVVADV